MAARWSNASAARAGQAERNLARIETNTANFARWGNNYAYHMGDLSAAVLNHPGRAARKYDSWGKALFHECPTSEPKLRHPVRFWCAA